MSKTFIFSIMVILAAGICTELPAQNTEEGQLIFEEDFERTFKAGKAFLPNWKGTPMRPGVMGQYTESGNSSLYMIPEGEEETPTIALLSLNLSDKKMVYMTFRVATRKNGTAEDRKRTRLSVAISTDGGRTFAFGKKIGPEMGMDNADTEFMEFDYPFPPTADGKRRVVIRFQGKAGGGPHLASKVLIDDVVIKGMVLDNRPPFIVGEVSPSSLSSIRINFSEQLEITSAETKTNYTFGPPSDSHNSGYTSLTGDLPEVSSASVINDGYSVLLKLNPPMEQGEYYSLQIDNISDLAGNSTSFTIDELVHNVPPPGSLIFTEVFFHDPSSATPMQKLQFIEIYNPTNKAVPLGGLRIKGAVSAHNMPNKKISPGEYYVITRNAVAFEETFGRPAWEWKGSWIQYDDSHEDEPIEPQELFIQTTDHHGAEYVDHISFDLGRPSWAVLNQPGYSMELCNVTSLRSSSSDWVLADEEGRSFTYSSGGSSYDIYATPFKGRADRKSCGPRGNKVIVCHENRDLCVGSDEVAYHLSHGDKVGSCQSGCDNTVGFRSELQEEPVTETYLRIIPNPVRDRATIRISPDLGQIRLVELFGLNGDQLRRMENVDQIDFSFPTLGLPAGVYMLRIRTELGVYTERMVIQ